MAVRRGGGEEDGQGCVRVVGGVEKTSLEQGFGGDRGEGERKTQGRGAGVRREFRW